MKDIYSVENEYETMENKHQNGLNNFKPKVNLNHNIYISEQHPIMITSVNDHFCYRHYFVELSEDFVAFR